MSIPLLKEFILWLAVRFNLIVAHQDRCIVNTQISKRDEAGTGENLIPGDHSIMEFGKKRKELKKAAESVSPSS